MHFLEQNFLAAFAATNVWPHWLHGRVLNAARHSAVQYRALPVRQNCAPHWMHVFGFNL